MAMSLKKAENVALLESRAIFRATYATFSLRNLCFFIYTRLSTCWTFYGFFFQPGALKTTNTLECGINKRFGTNTEVTVNLFDVISIIFSFPFNLVLRAILKKSPFSYSD